MRSKQRRRGAVTVEFALVVPIFITLIFAGLEFSRVNMIRNSVENAVYEGARKGIVPGATVADCDAAVQEQLDILGLQGTNITVTPSPIQPNSNSVTVSVTVPLTVENGYVTPKFYLGETMQASITLARERTF